MCLVSRKATVNAGVLALQNPVAPTGDVVIAGSATLRVTGNGAKLFGRFYNYRLEDQTELNTVAGIEALFAGRTPNVTAAVGATMDFGSNGSGFPAPYNNTATDYFIAKWEGRFYAPVSGEYSFRLRSDDGSGLAIDGQIVVANGSLQSYAGSDQVGSLSLSVGYHDFLLAYSEVGGGQGLTLDMAYPGGTLAAMPTSLLSGGGEAVITSISSATGALLEIQNGAALALDLGVNTTFDGRIVAGTSDGAVLIKRGAGTLSLDPNGHAIAGMTSVEGGTLAITSDGKDSLGRMHIEAGAQLSVEVLASGSAKAGIAGQGLLGYYYDYGSAETTAFEAALNSGNLNTVETFLAGQTINRIENSTTSADVFSFGLGFNGIGAFPPGYENTDYFSAVWYGQIVIPSSGSYKFQTNSDDGSMLYINGALVVNNSGRHGQQWREGTVSLAAGAHDIVVTFFEVTGGDHVAVQIDMGSGWINLPQSMLRPAMAGIGALSGSGTLSIDANAGGLLINQDVNTTFAGDVAGTNTAVIFKDGASTLTLTGDNSAFVGDWSVQQGTLQVGDGVTSGVLGGSGVYVRTGAVLLFNCPDDTVYAGTVSGGGLIRSIGGGQLTLSGNLSGFTGVLDIGENGVLEMFSTSLLAIPVVTNAGVFIVGEGIMLTGVAIAGEGTTIVAEGGSLNIGANPMLNQIELDGGMLMAAGTNILTSLAVSTNGTSELLLDVTADGQEFGTGNLILEAGARLEVYAVGGLMSRYYDARPADAIYTSVAAFTNWAAGQSVTIYTSTSTQPGDNLQFGNTGALFPGKYSSGASNFSALYQGRIVIAIPGEYTFGVSSDDNGMLFINNALIVDHNGGHAYTLKTGTVTLAAGVHDFCLLFGQGGGGYGLTAYITYPGAASSMIIPNSILIPLDTDAPMAYTLAADAVSVINAPGAGTVDMNAGGTLTFPALAVELASHLAVEGAAAVAGTTLAVTIDQEVGPVKELVGDFTAADGLDLTGVTLTLTGSEGSLLYKESKLYIFKAEGTLLLLK